MKRYLAHALLAALLISHQTACAKDVDGLVNRELTSLLELYKTLHAEPELSYHEEKTSERIALEWEQTGYQVTRHVGGFGVVAVMKNGDGPTLMLRTETDALPVVEETGLPYASKVTVKDESGKEIGVMHACGHDIHMASLTGAARLLAQLTNEWHGTLVLIAQPAEERGGGAIAMLADGLFQRFPKPDFCVALHDSADAPAGIITYSTGFSSANADSVDITVRGVGGHGAYPQKTKDPVLLAAQIIVALQTIVSRETRPGDAVVVTVGTIHGGTKNNIIPDEVKMSLTVRTFGDESRKKTLAAIKRIALGCAVTAGIPDDLMPVVKFGETYTPSLYNDPKLTERVIGALTAKFGETNIWLKQPGTGAEDFSRYGRTNGEVPVFSYWMKQSGAGVEEFNRYGRTEDKIPIFMFNVGAVNRRVYDDAKMNNTVLPSLHSSRWAPDPEPTIKTAVTAFTIAALDLLKK